MANKIIFGADLIDVLENKYNMNKLGEVPTKYKNGVTTIDFIYGKEKDIDDLKYDKPYVEFSIDDETDGFISGTMYPNGGVEGIQFDSWEDLKYFMKNAKWTESKKSATKSLKEGIDVKIVYADDTPSEYIDDVTHNDILDIIEESPEVYKIFDVSGSKKKLVWSDEYGFERAYESKKSSRKSLKEGINDELIATSSDGETALYLSDERQANHGKDPHYEFKLGENGYFTRYIRCDDERCENVVLDWIKEFDLDISKSEISKIIKLHESKKFTRKSMKESTDESFSLYDLNKHDPFIKEWVKNINKELKDVSIESIGDNEIIFRVWFDESIDLDIFDDIATDCMPRTLIEFMSDMNIDFGYQFVYADDKFTENDFVFIRFVAW